MITQPVTVKSYNLNVICYLHVTRDSLVYEFRETENIFVMEFDTFSQKKQRFHFEFVVRHTSNEKGKEEEKNAKIEFQILCKHTLMLNNNKHKSIRINDKPNN